MHAFPVNLVYVRVGQVRAAGRAGQTAQGRAGQGRADQGRITVPRL